jgi:MFS family permease
MYSSPSAIRLILIMCVAEVLGMAGVFAFPALLPRFLQEWGLSNTEAGWINGIYYAGYTVTVPVLASLTDRIDARRVYLTSAAVAALAALGFALFANGFWTACLFRALGGFGLAGTFIPGLKVLVDRLYGTAQARAIAIYTATFGIGTSLSFFGAGELGARFGWRWAFALAAASAVVALALAGTTVRPKPPGPGETPDSRLLDFRPVLRNRKAMSYVLTYTAHMWELFAMRSWMVAFLAFSLSLQPADKGHWSPATVAALAALVAVVANLGGAELAIRLGRRRILTLIMWGSALFAFGFGFTAALPYPIVAGLCVLYTMFVTADSGAIHTGAVLSAEPERRGATMAIQSLLGFAIASVAPLVIGVVLDATGSGQSINSWGAAFISMGIVVAVGPIILALLCRKTGGKTMS